MDRQIRGEDVVGVYSSLFRFRSAWCLEGVEVNGKNGLGWRVGSAVVLYGNGNGNGNGNA